MTKADLFWFNERTLIASSIENAQKSEKYSNLFLASFNEKSAFREKKCLERNSWH